MTIDVNKFGHSELMRVVELAFYRATASPDIARWRSVSIMAGCAAVRMAADGHLFMAAQFEGVAEECRRQAIEMSKEKYDD